MALHHSLAHNIMSLTVSAQRDNIFNFPLMNNFNYDRLADLRNDELD